MRTTRHLAMLVVLLALSGRSLADTGAHYYMPHHSHGKIQRSAKAKSEFRHSHPCPATGKKSGPCHGYVIDHVRPLKRGGADSPSNMQWQTAQAAKAKDKVE